MMSQIPRMLAVAVAVAAALPLLLSTTVTTTAKSAVFSPPSLSSSDRRLLWPSQADDASSAVPQSPTSPPLLPYCFDLDTYKKTRGLITDTTEVLWGTANTTNSTPCLIRGQQITFNLSGMMAAAETRYGRGAPIIINISSVVIENGTLEISIDDSVVFANRDVTPQAKQLLHHHPLIFVLADSNISTTYVPSDLMGLTRAKSEATAENILAEVQMASSIEFYGALPYNSNVTIVGNTWTKTGVDKHLGDSPATPRRPPAAVPNTINYPAAENGLSLLALYDVNLRNHTTFTLMNNTFSLSIGTAERPSQNFTVGSLVYANSYLTVSQDSHFIARENQLAIDVHTPAVSTAYLRRYSIFEFNQQSSPINLTVIGTPPRNVSVAASSSLIFEQNTIELKADVTPSEASITEGDTQVLVATAYVDGALFVADSSTYGWRSNAITTTVASTSRAGTSSYAEYIKNKLSLQSESTFLWENNVINNTIGSTSSSLASLPSVSGWKITGGFVQDSGCYHSIRGNTVQLTSDTENNTATNTSKSWLSHSIIDISDGDISITYPTTASSNVYTNQYTGNAVTLAMSESAFLSTLNHVSMVRLAPERSSTTPLLSMTFDGSSFLVSVRPGSRVEEGEGDSLLLEQQQKQQPSLVVSFLWTNSSVALAALSFYQDEIGLADETPTPTSEAVVRANSISASSSVSFVPVLWHADSGTLVSLFQPSFSCLLVGNITLDLPNGHALESTNITTFSGSFAIGLLPYSQLVPLTESGLLGTGELTCAFAEAGLGTGTIVVILIFVALVVLVIGLFVGVSYYRKRGESEEAAAKADAEETGDLETELSETSEHREPLYASGGNDRQHQRPRQYLDVDDE